MSNQQIMQESWKELRGRIREKWGEITDSDLDIAAGNVERLIGLVQRKTGESRESIDQFLSEAMAQCQSSWQNARQSLQDFSSATWDEANVLGHEAVQQLHAGYVQSERFVRRHPLETMAVCLGVGLVAGVVATALTRR